MRNDSNPILAGVWCCSSSHEAQHLIIDGAAACGSARLMRWDSWRLVKADELDVSRQCSRCKHHVGAVTAPPTISNGDMLAKFREFGRIGGKIGGKASTPAKRRAALRREAFKRAQSPYVVGV